MSNRYSQYHKMTEAVKQSVDCLGADLFKLKCTRELESTLNNFVAGVDGATFDGGLVICDEKLPEKPEDRMPMLLEKYSNQKVVLGLCLKTIEPSPHPKQINRFSYTFTLTEAEKRCTAFIFQNPSEPDRVALVPRYYLPKISSTRDGEIYAAEDTFVIGAEPEFLPVEWAAFGMPRTTLKQALESLVEFCTVADAKWMNPHCQIQLKGCPKPALHPPELLLPIHPRALANYRLSEEIRMAFGKHSTTYSVDRVLAARNDYDFAFFHRASQTRTIVNVEHSLCRLDKEGKKLQHLGILKSSYSEDTPTAIISPVACFDILLTGVIDSSAPRYLLLTRDELPGAWFSANATIVNGQTHESTWWKPDQEDFLSKRTIVWPAIAANDNNNDDNGKQGSVRRIEAMLDHLMATSNFTAKKKRHERGDATLDQRLTQIMKDCAGL